MGAAPPRPTHDGPADHRPPSGASVTRTIPATPSVVWAVLTDARQHEPWIPLTSISADEPGIGANITAVSGPRWRGSRRGLVDRMVVTRFNPPGSAGAAPADVAAAGSTPAGSSPAPPTPTPPTPAPTSTAGPTPGVATFTKLGPVLLGEATITVVDDGAGRSRVTWSETVWLAHGPRRPAAAVAAPLLRGMISRVLRMAAASITASDTVVPRSHRP